MATLSQLLFQTTWMYDTTWRQRVILLHSAVLVYPVNNFEKCRLIFHPNTCEGRLEWHYQRSPTRTELVKHCKLDFLFQQHIGLHSFAMQACSSYCSEQQPPCDSWQSKTGKQRKTLLTVGWYSPPNLNHSKCQASVRTHAAHLCSWGKDSSMLAVFRHACETLEFPVRVSIWHLMQAAAPKPHG